MITTYTSPRLTVGYCSWTSSAESPRSNAATIVSNVTRVPPTRQVPPSSIWIGTGSGSTTPDIATTFHKTIPAHFIPTGEHHEPLRHTIIFHLDGSIALGP